MSILLVLGYLLPIIGVLAAAALGAGILGLSGYTLYENLQERRVAAGQVARVRA